jgi:L-alanine-DL-glutamate epimerase-like enolase superfamily enzyme
MNMKIRQIHAYPLRYPEPNDFHSMRHTLLVKVETDEGVSGWGEAIAMWPEAVKAIKVLIEEGFSPLLNDMDPLDTEAIWIRMKKHTWWYGEGGLASFAISGVDMAVWDIKGKILRQPLYKLFGGAIQPNLPACASTHPSKPTNQENAQELASYIQSGFQSVKIGFGKKGHARLGVNAAHDIDFVRRVRAEIGPDAGFMVDIGNAVEWDIPTAIRMTRAFEAIGITWIEEPLHPDNTLGFKELRSAVSTLIATGEREYTMNDYYKLIQDGYVDVVGIDPGRAEGVTGFLKIREMVGNQGRKFNAHCWSSAVTSAASLHLSISSKHCMVLEYKPLDNPLQNELVEEAVIPQNGCTVPIDRPGLGIDVREEIIRKYSF